MRSFIFGRLLLTTCNQGGAAPLLDYGRSESADGRVFWSRVLLLTPWRRDKYGESLPQRGLVVGWQSTMPVWWAHWKPKRRRAGPPVTSTPDGAQFGNSNARASSQEKAP